MQTRDEILRDNPLSTYLARAGIKLRGSGRQRTTNQCPFAIHKPEHLCVSVEMDREIWHCNDCDRGGSIIDWLMAERNQSAKEVLQSLQKSTAPVSTDTKPRIVALYDYLNESRELVYQAVRLEPKSFRQRRPDGNGGWIWDMEGVTRVLFNLPEVIAAQNIVICEGEKDCLTAGRFDFVATCNVGGAGKWLDAYSAVLKGRDVIVFPDSDEPGRKHADEIVKSISEVANSVKRVVVPQPFKDLTEFAESFPDIEHAKREVLNLIGRTGHCVKPLPIYTLRELEERYREQTKTAPNERFNLSKFLPEFGNYFAPMVPGEMLLVLADTGVGKTMLLQHLVRAAAPLPSLLFELELPDSLLFERFVQMEIGCYRSDVQDEYRQHDVPLWTKYHGLLHVSVCPESGLSVDQIESYIVRSQLKLGRKPVVVAVDYVGLIRNLGARSRYEAMSNVAEDLKVVAKRTNTIMIIASQIARPDKKKQEITIGLHDAKDSGSLENSAGIVIGAWRPERTRLMLKILKNTSGQSGGIIEANIDGATMRISPAGVH